MGGVDNQTIIMMLTLNIIIRSENRRRHSREDSESVMLTSAWQS